MGINVARKDTYVGISKRYRRSKSPTWAVCDVLPIDLKTVFVWSGPQRYFITFQCRIIIHMRFIRGLAINLALPHFMKFGIVISRIRWTELHARLIQFHLPQINPTDLIIFQLVPTANPFWLPPPHFDDPHRVPSWPTRIAYWYIPLWIIPLNSH